MSPCLVRNFVQIIYDGFSVVLRMMSDVFSCSIDIFRCSQMFLVFSGSSHLLTDVLKMCSNDLRCSEMFSNDHKCWMLDFFLGLLMVSGFSQDGLRIFSGCSDGSCERGGSGGFDWLGGSGRSGESCGYFLPI